MTETLRIGLVGPDQSQPCGIADYTSRLGAALAGKSTLAFIPFLEAWTDLDKPGSRLATCQAILVQYERSLVPDSRFLPRLTTKFPGRVFVVPHEVYPEDPFAFPYGEVRSHFPPLLWLKRLRYRWKHREYAREKNLQRQAYVAQAVFPLSGPSRDILQANARAGAHKRILDPIPLAYFIPPSSDSKLATVSRENFFTPKVRQVIGIFGFLNPGLDYGMALDLLEKLDVTIGLLLIGGARPGQPEGFNPEAEAAKRGLAGRVKVTGYLPEAELSGHLKLCDAFLAPLRFKSASSSLLNLIHLGKHILVRDLPLTRWLQAEGVPLELYAGTLDLAEKLQAVLAGLVPMRKNRYPWSMEAAAEAYIKALQAALRS